MTTKTQEPESARLVNTVLLVGRVSAAPESRAMPSGDELVQFRLVVPRPEVRGQTRTPVDTIDIACWSARSRGSAGRLQKGDIIEVEAASVAGSSRAPAAGPHAMRWRPDVCGA